MTLQEMIDVHTLLTDRENALHTSRELSRLYEKDLRELRALKQPDFFVCHECKQATVHRDYDDD